MVPSANSCRLVLPTKTAPAARSRADDHRIARRHVSAPHARGRSRWRAAKIDEILERDRHAVQRAAITAGGNLLVGVARLRTRLVGEHRDEGVDRRIAFGDAREAAVGDGFGAGRPRLKRARQLGQRAAFAARGVSGRLQRTCREASRAARRSASRFQSAARSAAVDRASPSSSGRSAGSSRRSASCMRVFEPDFRRSVIVR